MYAWGRFNRDILVVLIKRRDRATKSMVVGFGIQNSIKILFEFFGCMNTAKINLFSSIFFFVTGCGLFWFHTRVHAINLTRVYTSKIKIRITYILGGTFFNFYNNQNPSIPIKLSLKNCLPLLATIPLQP